MAHKKAGYICADQTVIFIFRLQKGGGPYIPVCRLLCAMSAKGREAESRVTAYPMRVGPSESACRSRFQTTFRRLWPKAMVVSAEGKGPALTGSGIRQEEDRKGTTVEVSKAIKRCQNRGVITTAGQAPTVPVYGRSGIRHERWPELANEAVRRNMGSLQVMLRENL